LIFPDMSDVKIEFARNLRQIMDKNKIKAPVLAEKINIKRGGVNAYLRGERMPSYNTLIAITRYFGCSADYLFGRADDKNRISASAPSSFSERLRAIMTERHITQYALEHKTGVSRSLVYWWLTDKHLPNGEYIYKLSECLNCSADSLLVT